MLQKLLTIRIYHQLVTLQIEALDIMNIITY
jgi:hypothetical protein